MSDEQIVATWPAGSVCAKERERHILWERTHCKWFNGVQNERCDVQVRYDSFEMRRLPCLFEAEAAACPKREVRSFEEAEQLVDEREKRTAEFLQKVALGICECGSESTDWSQVGRCIYSRPCGHRVGQGDAKAFKKAVLKAREARGSECTSN